jgi:hypothetical protein
LSKKLFEKVLGPGGCSKEGKVISGFFLTRSDMGTGT